MSYPINSSILYYAIPYTRGFTVDDHVVTWTFGDGSTFQGTTTTKTWNTVGNKPFTAVAVNKITGTSASVSKSIDIDLFNWSLYGGSLASNSQYPIAVTLSDGNVMSIGGYSGKSYITSNGSWSQIASPSYARNASACVFTPCGVELDDGRVLVAGLTRSAATESKSEIYNRSTNTWSPTGDLAIGVSRRVYMVKADDGRAFIFAGRNEAQSINNNAYQYFDHNTMTWTSGPDILTPYQWDIGYITGSGYYAHTSTILSSWFANITSPIKLANGDIFFISPDIPIIPEPVTLNPATWKYELAYRCFVFHPDDNSFTYLTTRDSVFNITWSNSTTYAQAADGFVYVFGFTVNKGSKLSVCCKVDPDAGTYSLIAECPYGLGSSIGAFPVEGGNKIHVVGIVLDGADFGSIIYDPATNTWGSPLPYANPRLYVSPGSVSGFALSNGRPFVFGSSGVTSEIFNGS